MTATLPTLTDQAERLIELGVHGVAGLSADRVREAAGRSAGVSALLVVHHDLDRGDAMANWSPDEALPAITDGGRTPLTLTEGVHWLLQRPDVLERGRCFMTIGSRLLKSSGALDARTPALWISNGSGRDGKQNRDAPKVGWCWAANRHTWLGFGSAASRATADV